MWEVLASLGVLAGAKPTHVRRCSGQQSSSFGCMQCAHAMFAHCRSLADARLCDVSKESTAADDDDDADHGGSCLPRA